MTLEVVPTFLPYCPLGLRRLGPTAGNDTLSLTCKMPRIFDLKCLSCDWCLLLTDVPILAVGRQFMPLAYSPLIQK